MNKIDIENKLNELKDKNCQAVWFILKNRPHQGANFKDIINNEKSEQIELKQNEIYLIIPYRDIRDIEYIF